MFMCNVGTFLSNWTSLFESNLAWSRYELLNRQSACEPHFTYMIHACFERFLITRFDSVYKQLEDVKLNLWLRLSSGSIQLAAHTL